MKPQPKRILIVTREIVPFHYGGIGTQFKNLAGFLRQRGHDVAILTERHTDFEEAIFQKNYGDIPIHFAGFFSSDPVTRPLAYAKAVERVFDRLCADETTLPDVVICADFEAECFFLLLKACSGVYEKTRFILNINGMTHDVLSVHEGGEEARSENSVLNAANVRLICAMEELCIGLADILAPSTEIYWDQIRRRMTCSRPVQPIPNFRDGGLFRVNPAGEIQPTGGASGSKIIFVGRLDRMKGTDLLLKAYLRLSEDRSVTLPDIVFVGRDCFWKEYGDTFLGHWRSRIPAYLTEKIAFTGQIEHQRVADHLREAAFCVFPSRLEPFGIVCLEAMGMGCPIVVPRGTGLEEVVGASFPDGLFVHDEDGQNLAERMRFLLNHPPLPKARETLRQRALLLNEVAEQGWISLIESEIVTDQFRRENIKWAGPVLSLLSLLQPPQNPDLDHLQIYFSRKQHYEELDSIRVSYPRGRWNTLTIALPGGTGDPHLRLDPMDRSGEVLIKEIALLDNKGKDLWRCDGGSGFKDLNGREAVKMISQGDLLLLSSSDSDPQLLLDCPNQPEPVTLRITLFSQLCH